MHVGRRYTGRYGAMTNWVSQAAGKIVWVAAEAGEGTIPGTKGFC
jgi:hypothetical protein